jgi:hypothetical protein
LQVWFDDFAYSAPSPAVATITWRDTYR